MTNCKDQQMGCFALALGIKNPARNRDSIIPPVSPEMLYASNNFTDFSSFIISELDLLLNEVLQHD